MLRAAELPQKAPRSRNRSPSPGRPCWAGTNLCNAKIWLFPANARLPGQAWCCWRQRRCLYLPSLRSARGGERENFPNSFPCLKGKKEKESHDLELHERQRGEKVTQTAKNLLRCCFSFLLCSAAGAEGSGRGWVTAPLPLPAERGGTEGGRRRMSSCEGAGTFWAGRNVDAAVQGFLQSWLFPQNPSSLRRTAPCGDSNKAAQEGLRFSAELKVIYICSPLQAGKRQQTVTC